MVAVFELLRLGILVHYWDMAAAIPAGVLFKSFLVGLRFDLTITGYILSLPVLIGLLPKVGWTDSKLLRKISTVYISVLASVAFFMTFIDLGGFFGEFDTRLNHIALDWADTPGLSVLIIWENVFVPLYVGMWAVLCAAFVFILTRVDRKLLDSPPPEPTWRRWVIYPLALGLTFLAIRGRIEEKAPINWSVAYFSQYHFANQLALNSVFTFVRDAILDRGARQEAAAMSAIMSAEEAYAGIREHLGIDELALIDSSPIARECSDGEVYSYNVIVVIAESFAANFTQSCGGTEDFAPEFDKMSGDGLLFTRFFANGMHTYSGMFSTVTGLFTTPGRPIMKISEGQQEFAGLASVLKRRDYTTRCYLTHDPIFDNKQGFLLQNGYERVVSLFDYTEAERLSTVGVADEVMYERALQDFEELPRPFYALLQTGSSHGPFVVPDRPHRKPDPEQREWKRINAFLYTDWALAQFYHAVKNSLYADSTLFVVVADNGHPWNTQMEMDISNYWIPLLLIGPGIDPGKSDLIGSLKDVTATVMDVLGGEWINATMGQSMLTDPPGYALFVEGQSFGYIEDDVYLVKRRDGSLRLYQYPGLDEVEGELSRIESMEEVVQTYLAATHYLIFDRKGGLPN
jgi:phosphoglycerol transferase MdoB-like AlkP superfamily enzyme